MSCTRLTLEPLFLIRCSELVQEPGVPPAALPSVEQGFLLGLSQKQQHTEYVLSCKPAYIEVKAFTPLLTPLASRLRQPQSGPYSGI